MSTRRSLGGRAVGLVAAGMIFGLACSSPSSDGPAHAEPTSSGPAATADGGESARAERDSAIPPPTAEPPPAPTGANRLVDGEVLLLGVTTDGFAIYVANRFGDGPLHAVPLTGGAPVLLAPFVHHADVIVQARGVAFWTNVANNPYRGTLNLWSAASGSKMNVGTSVPGEVHFSDDATRVVVLVNPLPLAVPPTVDVAVTNVAAPSLAPVISGMNTDSDADLAATCTAHYAFVGSLLYMSYCTTTSPGQALFQSVSAAGAVTTHIDNVVASAGVQSAFMLDQTASKAFFLGTNREARVFTIATGTSTVLDTNVVDGRMSRDGASAVYVKEFPPPSPDDLPTYSLHRSPTAIPSPVTLQDGIGGLLAATPDLSSVMFNVAYPRPDGRTDLYALDTLAPPAPPLIISDQPTARALGFTASGSHMLYLTQVGGASGAGELTSRPTTSGGLPRTVSTNASGATPIGSGSKVVLCANPTSATTVGDFSTCDLTSFDAATSAAPALAAKKADPYYYTRGEQLVFALSWGPSRGIYVKDVP